MRVGLALPQYDSSVPGVRPLRWSTVETWARTAEQLGFRSLWLSDHLFVDTALFGPPGRVAPLDALPVLAAVARVTRHVRLGTLVLCTPLRPPAVVAKALATLDVLSGGRLTVGLGAGWHEAELREAGVPGEAPGGRLDRLAEAIEVLRGMFGGGPFSYEGRYWRVEEARCLPRPRQQPGPPIWVGGSGDRLLGVTGRLADGWNTAWSSTVEAYRARTAVLDRACEQAGRDPSCVTRSLGLHTLVGENGRDLARRFDRMRRLSPPGSVRAPDLGAWRRGRLVGTVEEVAEQLQQWSAAGVSELVVNPGALPFHAVDLDDLPLIAQACSLEASWVASELRN